MFKPVDTRQSFPKLEEEILRFWRENDIFRKSVAERPEERPYIFYEGPPTANARPGVHHVLARVFKDLFPRYKTMRGYRVERKAGWDTHGLPVELEVERDLGLKSKTEIEEFGIEEFNRRCRESVFRYVKDWEALTERIGFWVDMENAYVTYDNGYIESVWWAVKRLWEGGLLYLDYRSTPHCPRCGTSLSDAEVALGYKDAEDPSVYVKFRLTAESVRTLSERVFGGRGAGLPAYIVAWTTTPWTLPGNTALAVKPDAAYAVKELGGELLIFASNRISAIDADKLKAAPRSERDALALEQTRGTATGETLFAGDFLGQALVGLKYEPLYSPTQWGVNGIAFRPFKQSVQPPGNQTDEIEVGEPKESMRLVPVDDCTEVENAYTTLPADFVSLDDGSGVVHIAPAFGGEDFDLGKQHQLLFLQPVDLRGRFPEGSPWPSQFVKDADPAIIDDLSRRGLVYHSDTTYHTYPFCWRCDERLLYYAKPTWYIRTTAAKDRLIAGNERINWYPEHIKRGRFGDWLRNNVDWALSRERYWGTPLPIWQCVNCSERVCVGSRDGMRKLALDPEAVDALTDLHRPYVDRIELRCEPMWVEDIGEAIGCGGTMKRVPEVLDAWFDSGAMPYAQWHYPAENAEAFKRGFPADFICEAVDQTRGWFYTLHAEAVLLNPREEVSEGLCYRNVICLGHILDDKGRKMSKSLGNVVEPMSVIENNGADALRWYLYTATRPGDARRFSDKLVSESLRRFLLTLWNTYSFFVTYANLDGFDPQSADAGEQSELDRWVLSELNALVRKVTDCLEEYDPTTSGRAIQRFIEDLSNWYVRRSRRRFWKSGADADKLAAYQTLYTCLVTVTKLLAPFTPFVAEAMYQNLARSASADVPESVHLATWPEADESRVDRRLMEETRTVMRVVSLGRAARSKAGLKVRQPLAVATAFVHNAAQAIGLKRLEAQVLDELNVKELSVLDTSEVFKGRNAVEHPKDLLALLPEGAVLAEDEAGYAVGLDTNISRALADEGLAREFVHRLQSMRKAAGFEISDRVAVSYSESQRLRDVLATHGDYVRGETLADEITEGTPQDIAHAEEQTLEGESVTLSVRRVGE